MKRENFDIYDPCTTQIYKITKKLLVSDFVMFNNIYRFRKTMKGDGRNEFKNHFIIFIDVLLQDIEILKSLIEYLLKDVKCNQVYITNLYSIDEYYISKLTYELSFHFIHNGQSKLIKDRYIYILNDFNNFDIKPLEDSLDLYLVIINDIGNNNQINIKESFYITPIYLSLTNDNKVIVIDF
jgi:hypothetical protein